MDFSHPFFLFFGRFLFYFLKIKKVFIYLFIYLSIYLFMAVLSLRCCLRAFSRCSKQGLLFVAVHRLLIAVASRCGARALGARASVVYLLIY